MLKFDCATVLTLQGRVDKYTSVDNHDWLSVFERSRHVRCVRKL